MKKLTTLLILCMVLMAATCQEPDLHGYTQEYVDSLEVIIDFQDSILNDGFNYFGARQDTFLYSISGMTDSLFIQIDKQGINASIHIIDKEIDRRFHIYYNDRKRSFSVGDGVNSTSTWPLDRY